MCYSESFGKGIYFWIYNIFLVMMPIVGILFGLFGSYLLHERMKVEKEDPGSALAVSLGFAVLIYLIVMLLSGIMAFMFTNFMRSNTVLYDEIIKNNSTQKDDEEYQDIHKKPLEKTKSKKPV